MNRMTETDRLISEREIRHVVLSRIIAADGCVLLKNSGALPFGTDVHTVALFGAGARRTVKGGSGSGDVNVRCFVSVEQGLENAGFSVVTKQWLNEYDGFMDSAKEKYDAGIRSLAEQGVMAALGTLMGKPFVAPVFRALREEECEKYTADAAVYVLSRHSGEGADRTLNKGDWLLSDEEIHDILLLNRSYSRFVLLLNVGSAVDLTPVLDDVGTILLIGQGGSAAGNAAADVIAGKISPSGKLCATWAKSYTDYPGADPFINGDPWNTYYSEGIFVGYRWFQKQSISPAFAFGFGLSYTGFRIDAAPPVVTGCEIRVSVTVTNTGKTYAGKEVVQIYVSPPKSDTEKAGRMLVAFGKTRLLQPGQAQSMTLAFSPDALAFYDADSQMWRIEQGEYTVLAGNSSEQLQTAGVISCEERAFSAKMHRTEDDSGTLSKDLTVEELASLCVGNARTSLLDLSVIGNASKSIPGAAGETTDALTEKGVGSLTMADGPAGIRVNPKIYEKDGLYINHPKDDPILSLVLPEQALTADTDGAALKYQYCTALPVAATMAQTWDLALLEQAGDMIGTEMDLLDIDLWLAPGMNIQRNPLCGRNFEYFSEDPFLTGKCAAAVTKGVQKHPGRGVTVKHFACNNKETNRNYNNSVVSERALREIYLRGFEICVREASPFAVMTAYNLLNGTHCANDRRLLTDILRNEWGFDGLVMTDWYATKALSADPNRPYGCSDPVACISAGNDLIMPGSEADRAAILAAAEDGSLPEELLRRSAERILRTIKRCGK